MITEVESQDSRIGPGAAAAATEHDSPRPDSGGAAEPAQVPLAPARFTDPRSLLNLSPAPTRLVSSARSGWDGAFLIQATSPRDGEIRHDHERVAFLRRLTPLHARPLDGRGGWTTHGPGTWLRLPGDGDHAAWRGATQWHWLFVTPERVEDVLGKRWDRSGLVRWRDPELEQPFAEDVLSALQRDCEAGHPAGPLAGDALVVALLSHLDGRGAADAPPPRRTFERRVAAVCDHIEANLARPLSLSALARLAGLGVRRFGAIFAAQTGWSPHRYLLNRRIERAKELMLDPALTLTQIALTVGFADQAQFSRVFRRYVGEAPRAYRRR
jgi:AraC family transcriptional regulator